MFAFVLLPILILLLASRFSKDLSADEVADRAEHLLNGTFGSWDVDDYEHLGVRDSKIRELWRKTLEIGGMPEEWTRIEEDKKSAIQSIIAELRAKSSIDNQKRKVN